MTAFSSTILGTQSGFWVLNDPTHNDHERGELCKFQARGLDLENIVLCTILKDGRDDWELDYIKGKISIISCHIVHIIWIMRHGS